MLVRFSTDFTGSVHGEPVNDRIAAKFAAHMEEMTGHHDATVFFQEHEADDLASMIPARQFRDLMNGWTVKCRIDPWDYGMMLGYDAHNVPV